MTESVEPADVHDLINRGEAVLVDVRDAAAFATSHPQGAINIPIGELADRLDELPDGAQVITSCGGGTRGPKAAAQLGELGVEARVMKGGLRGWSGAGLAVTARSEDRP